jgi:hypothetical protein
MYIVLSHLDLQFLVQGKFFSILRFRYSLFSVLHKILRYVNPRFKCPPVKKKYQYNAITTRTITGKNLCSPLKIK